MGCGATALRPADAAQGVTQPAPAQPAPDAEGNDANRKASSSSTLRHSEDSSTGRSEGESKVRTVMGKYLMMMSSGDTLGEGTSSICRRGTIKDTGEEVAIKVYKSSKQAQKGGTVLRKFERQIRVLKELQEPFVAPDDPTLSSEEITNTKPHRLFMELLDYSKDAEGQPGPDPTDGVLYVITEVGQYTLKDFLSLRREQAKPLPPELVWRVTKGVIHVMAGLHAKGFVHCDLKPENLMMFKGRLKLIDVDGCMRAGDTVSINDSSISFSPCYCAPEWARFLIEDSDMDAHESRIKIMPSLDVWSVGMTLCELVTLGPLLKSVYAKFLRGGNSQREAGFMFMEWLSSIREAPLVKQITKYDRHFVNLLTSHLLPVDPEKRSSCAQCLSHPFLAVEGSAQAKPAAVQAAASECGGSKENGAEDRAELDNQPIPRRARNRLQDESTTKPLYQGTIWKLNNGGNPQDSSHWQKRDAWIARTGALCYYSIKDSKRLVLLSASKLAEAEIKRCDGGSQKIAFEVRTPTDTDDEADVVFTFGCRSEEELEQWIRMIKEVQQHHVSTMRMGLNFVEELRAFRLKVKNRRRPVQKDARGQFEPVFKASLWKVKTNGDCMKEKDWVLREMWIAQNGSLVYWSKQEERELVYYSDHDLSRASFLRVAEAASCKPWTFQVVLPPSDGVEFTPGEFAASSEDLLEQWLAEFSKIREPPSKEAGE